MMASVKTAAVLYGSETGNAIDLAEEMCRMLERLHLSAFSAPLDLHDPETLRQFDVAIFAVSTTGQGEQPSNAKSFWKKLLRKKLGPGSLQSLSFAVFGLGDSSYPKYNWAALKLRKRLIQLGANEIIGFGKGDEQHPEGHDGTFVPWLQEIRQKLLLMFPLRDGQEPVPDDTPLQPQWLLSSAGPEASPSTVQTKRSTKSPEPDESEHIKVILNENTRVTPKEHWQDVRHLKLTTPLSISYVPGDVLVIYPENPPEDVTEVINLMGWHDVADEFVSLQPNTAHPSSIAHSQAPPSGGPHPTALTLRDWLTKRVDLNAVPRRSFFSQLTHFTTDEYQRSRLVEFTRSEYLDELYDYTTRPRRRVLEVLQEFDTVRIPWRWAAAVLPLLRGRQFSIASGGALKRGPDGGTVFELLVAIVEYRTVIRRIRRGVCTRYLAGLPAGTELTVFLERRGLGFSQMIEVRPMVMVGPGTGIAPVRSLIWERTEQRSRQRKAAKGTPDSLEAIDEMDQLLLFFGCRNANSDFFFRKEWDSLKEVSNLAVFPAFSRDQQRKVYVQDLISLHSARVFDLLHHLRGSIYVCGASGKMPRAVREALTGVFEKEGCMTRDEAEAYLRDMEKSGLYKQETW